MKMKPVKRLLPRRGRALGSGLSVLIALLAFAAPTAAFQLYDGDYFEARLDTTLSYGLQYRVKDRDDDIIGVSNGGKAFSVNGDDGNLNYDKGIVSQVFKATSELDLGTEYWGAFVRGTAFYDYENMKGDRERTDLTAEAEELVGTDVDLLDAYLWTGFDLGPVPIQFRLGEQVVSWGESTFIQNSINTINPVNVSAIRVPGAELKEALVPEGMIWASAGLTENVTVEGLYLYDWEETEIDPPGSYWSSNDFAGAGGKKVMLGFGAAPDNGDASAGATFLAVPRGPTGEADDQGQFGVALRWFAPWLNHTEFGFYYLRYHSRVPVISSTTGTAAGLGAAVTINGATGASVAAATGTYLDDNPGDVSGAIAAGVVDGVGNGMTQTQAGNIAQAAATGGDVAAAVTNSATDAYARTARYRTEYPEDIQLLGVSFNTEVGSSGIAVQGEVSHRRDVPLQVDDLELLFATLGGVNPGLAAGNQLGNYFGQTDTDIQGYIERNVTQAQATLTKLFGSGLGANQSVFLAEVGFTYVHDMPDSSDLRLEAPGTYISGNADLAYAHGIAADQIESEDAFADASSWGYRAVYKMDFNNVFWSWNLFPRIAWHHDVDGNSPGPGGNFLEGRKAITYGLGADYQQTWSMDVSYTDYFGAGRYNLINDRDFIGFNIKYSF